MVYKADMAMWQRKLNSHLQSFSISLDDELNVSRPISDHLFNIISKSMMPMDRSSNPPTYYSPENPYSKSD